jgi:GntR family transcriptional regulator
MNFKDKQSIYLQIGDYICDNILLGGWKIGKRIPSIREFAIEIEVNPNTVIRTYNYLEDLKIITKKRGVGYFVSKNAVKFISNIKKQIFVKERLPELFRQMELLEISWDEVNEYFSNYKSINSGVKEE